MNIWTLSKEPSIKVALLRMSSRFDLQRLSLDCNPESNRRAILICDRLNPSLNAYLFTYGQSSGRYGLQLQYPTEAPGSNPSYQAMEELGLEQLIELLHLHFELT